MIGSINGDDFHLVVTTSNPWTNNQALNSFRCVLLPEPSGPSNAIRNPRSLPLFVICLQSRSAAALQLSLTFVVRPVLGCNNLSRVGILHQLVDIVLPTPQAKSTMSDGP